MANETVIKNRFGNVAGWNEMECNILGRTLEGFTELEYSDEDEVEGIKGAGKFDVGIGTGNSSAKCSITMLQEERVMILDALPKGSRIQDIEPFTIVVTYEYRGRIYTDRINNCKFKNNGVAVKQGDMSISHKFELYCSHIDYNV